MRRYDVMDIRQQERGPLHDFLWRRNVRRPLPIYHRLPHDTCLCLCPHLIASHCRELDGVQDANLINDPP